MDVLQRQQLSDCLDDVSASMIANRLQLNHNKTEVLWFSARCQTDCSCPSWQHICSASLHCQQPGAHHALPFYVKYELCNIDYCIGDDDT